MPRASLNLFLCFLASGLLRQNIIHTDDGRKRKDAHDLACVPSHHSSRLTIVSEETDWACIASSLGRIFFFADQCIRGGRVRGGGGALQV